MADKQNDDVAGESLSISAGSAPEPKKASKPAKKKPVDKGGFCWGLGRRKVLSHAYASNPEMASWW